MERTGMRAFKPSFIQLSCAKYILEEFAPKLQEKTYREFSYGHQMSTYSSRAVLCKTPTTELKLLLIPVHRTNHCQKKAQRQNSALLIFISHWFQASNSSMLTQALHKLHTRNTDLQARCENPPMKTHKTILQTSLSSRPIIPLHACQHAAQLHLFTLSSTTLSRNHQFSGLLQDLKPKSLPYLNVINPKIPKILLLR